MLRVLAAFLLFVAIVLFIIAVALRERLPTSLLWAFSYGFFLAFGVLVAYSWWGTF